MDLKEATTIDMRVFDLSGRLIEKIQPISLTSGQFRQTVNLPTTGIFFIHVTAGNNSKVLRVVKM